MASISVHAPDGKTLTVQVPEGTDPGQYGHLADDALSHYTQSIQQPSFQSQIPGILKQAGNAVLGSSPANLTQKFMETDPGTMTRMAGPGLPIVGGMAGLMSPVPGGAAAGAMAGEGIRQSMANAFAPETGAKTIPGQLASIAATGVMQEPKILNEIPGVKNVSEMAGNLVSKVGGGMARAAQAFSGGKSGEFIEAAKKGYATYGAPSKTEAGAAMGRIIDKLPGKSVAPTMAEHIASAITPESSAGNKFLVDIGKRIDDGELITARQALKAKQSLDDVIDTVPIWQTKRRANLFELKKTFDDVLSNQSGELKQASNDYRAAVLKDNLTKFLPVNKHGEYSRLAPMLTSLASTVGVGVGSHKGGTEGSILGGLAPLAAMVALSPGSLGAGATSIGVAKQAINAIGSNPAARQVLLQVLQKIREQKKP